MTTLPVTFYLHDQCGCATVRISQFSESVCIKLDEWETLRTEIDAVVRAYRTLRWEGGNG